MTWYSPDSPVFSANIKGRRKKNKLPLPFRLSYGPGALVHKPADKKVNTHYSVGTERKSQFSAVRRYLLFLRPLLLNLHEHDFRSYQIFQNFNAILLIALNCAFYIYGTQPGANRICFIEIAKTPDVIIE